MRIGIQIHDVMEYYGRHDALKITLNSFMRSGPNHVFFAWCHSNHHKSGVDEFMEYFKKNEIQHQASLTLKNVLQRWSNSLVHACQCRDANCRFPDCHKMKLAVSHESQCKRKSNGGSPVS